MEPKCTGLTDGPTTSSHAPDLKDPHMINDAKPDQFVFFFFLKYICTNSQMSQKTAPMLNVFVFTTTENCKRRLGLASALQPANCFVLWILFG